jgi:hypothetical protein
MNSIKTSKMLNNIYKPNMEIKKEHAKTDVFEYLKSMGNLEHEPKLATRDNLTKIFGSPIKKVKFESEKVFNSKGVKMTNKEILDKKDDLRFRINYPRYLVIEKGERQLQLP